MRPDIWQPAARECVVWPKATRAAVAGADARTARRRRLAGSLQPAAERAGLAPGLARAQGRGCGVGAFHCSAAPRADDKPSREGGSPENLPGQELDPNRAPPDDTPSGPSGAAKVRPPSGPAPARPGGDMPAVENSERVALWCCCHRCPWHGYVRSVCAREPG
jgi:hypothetical protein